MEHRLGTLRGLDACASPHGMFTVLALDHRNNLRRILQPDVPESVGYSQLVEFKRSVLAPLASASSGVLLDPEVGAAQAIVRAALPGQVGLITAIEESGYRGSSNARLSNLLPSWSVAKAKRMGSNAVKLLLYYHPDAANAADQERLLMEVAETCADVDVPLFLEPLSFSLDESGPALSGDARREAVIRTARRLTALGGDVLKAEFPYDPSVTDKGRWREACAELDEASGIPWVILSAGVDSAAFEAQTLVACEAGASGVLVGRSVWGDAATLPAEEREDWLRSEGRARLQRLSDIVESSGTSWRRSSPLVSSEPVEQDWFTDYPA